MTGDENLLSSFIGCRYFVSSTSAYFGAPLPPPFTLNDIKNIYKFDIEEQCQHARVLTRHFHRQLMSNQFCDVSQQCHQLKCRLFVMASRTRNGVWGRAVGRRSRTGGWCMRHKDSMPATGAGYNASHIGSYSNCPPKHRAKSQLWVVGMW